MVGLCEGLRAGHLPFHEGCAGGVVRHLRKSNVIRYVTYEMRFRAPFPLRRRDTKLCFSHVYKTYGFFFFFSG